MPPPRYNTKAINASINKFPVEILVKIFAEAIPEFSWDILVDHKIYRGSHEGRSDPAPKVEDPHDSRLILLSVCKDWTKIVESTPRLWKSIHCNQPLLEDLTTLEHIISRSKNCPLEVFIDIPDSLEMVENFGRFTSILRRCMPRMRALMIVNETDYIDVSYLLMYNGVYVDAPYLEILALVRYWNTEPDPTMLFHAPRLTTLALIHNDSLLHFTEASLSSVQNLTVPICNFIEISRQVFPQYPALEMLYFTLPQSIILGPPLPNFPKEISLPYLKHLEVSLLSWSPTFSFFNHLRTPAIESMVIDCSFQPVNCSLAALEVFFAQDLPRLTHLNVQSIDRMYTDYDLGRILMLLPHLTSLEIVDCSLKSRFFTRLIVHDDIPDSEILCPRLETMICRNSIIDDSLLSDIIKSRTQWFPRSINGRPLQLLECLLL
ncbi:hypothetical protein BU17DRAFT_96454 [Hysterangium stoloniferum]|nr:hypothetical protein BU17DRAFT_96454 [Hysterangium stoloniferum]